MYYRLCAGTVEENGNAIAFYKHIGFVESTEVPEGITAADDSISLEFDLSKK